MRDAHPRPTVIIDECLPAGRFRAFFAARGYTVLTAGEAFPSGSPDASVLALAVDRQAVVVSTDQDWRKLISNVAGHRGKIRRAGRILSNCRHDRAFPRLEKLIDDIEREFEAATREGRSLLIRITESTFTVEKRSTLGVAMPRLRHCPSGRGQGDSLVLKMKHECEGGDPPCWAHLFDDEALLSQNGEDGEESRAEATESGRTDAAMIEVPTMTTMAPAHGGGGDHAAHLDPGDALCQPSNG